jgi:hypothetical protein
MVVSKENQGIVRNISGNLGNPRDTKQNFADLSKFTGQSINGIPWTDL